MRTAPLNYLVAVILGGIAWLLAAMMVGNYLSLNIPLLNATVEEFLGMYRLQLAIAMAISVACTCWWFFAASRPKASVQLDRGRRLWRILFLCTLTLNTATVFGLVLLFRDESFAFLHYVIFVGVLALNTWLLFWLATLLATPRTWMNLVPGRR